MSKRKLKRKQNIKKLKPEMNNTGSKKTTSEKNQSWTKIMNKKS